MDPLSDVQAPSDVLHHVLQAEPANDAAEVRSVRLQLRACQALPQAPAQEDFEVEVEDPEDHEEEIEARCEPSFPPCD